jgi:hypothetical protein
MNASIRLWSLLDMLKIYAHQFMQAGEMINELGGRLYMSEDEPDDPGRPLSADDKTLLSNQLKKLAATCKTLGLKVAARQMERGMKHPPKTSSELDCLVSVMHHELEERLFLFVPNERAAFYEMKISFPDFPNATKELVRAGNCFAAAEDVASVFHSMRAVEIALTAIYLSLGLTEPSRANKSWGNYCNGIRDELTKRGKSWARLGEFQEMLTTLVNVKDGWRNTSLHVDAHYSEEDAKRIFQSVNFFIEKVSSRMNEQGLPLA